MNLRPAPGSPPLLRLTGWPLRLVGASQPIAESPAAKAIARENRAASLAGDLNPTDPRWLLAARTRAELQGASLTADRRERLLGLAHDLGMRPFDANLVIAIVQDEARLASAGADSAWELADRLRVVPNRRESRTNTTDPASPEAGWRGVAVGPIFILGAAILLGLIGVLALLGWLTRG